MGFFRSKDPKTGEPRLGAGVYIVVCVLMVAGAVLWHTRQNAKDSFDKDTAPTAPVNPSVIAPIAEAAEDHKDATASDEPPGVATEVKSARDVDINKAQADPTKIVEQEDNLDTIQNTLDILRQNQEQADKEKAEAVAKARAESEAKIAELQRKSVLSSSSERAPAPSTGKEGTPQGNGYTNPNSVQEDNNRVEVDMKNLVVFDADRDIPAPTVKTQAQATDGFSTGHFLPRGYIFPVYTLTTIQTTGQEDIIMLGVAENVIFQHKVQIPFGTRLLGTAASTSTEDRVILNIDTILYPDGRELPISAIVKDQSDFTAGIKGYYIPQPLRIQMVPYINEFFASWTEAVVDRSSDNNSDSSSSDYSSKEESLSQSANLIRKQAEKIQERLDRRYPEKVVVPIGTRAYVQLRTGLDLTLAQVNGSKNNKHPILPGFENNPITAGGVVERTANQGVLPSGTGQLTSGTSSFYEAQKMASAMSTAMPKTTAVTTVPNDVQYYMSALKAMDSYESKLKSSSANKKSSSATTDWSGTGDIE